VLLATEEEEAITMTTTLTIVLAAALLAALYFLVTPVVRLYLKFRGRRVITCPENQKPAGVEVDAAYAAFSSFGTANLRLKECSHWPERQNCGQECLKQIEAAPEDCLVRTLLTRWYSGKTCAICRKPLGEIQWIEHKPALLSPDHITVEWREVAPEHVPEVLQSYLPVCWNCHVAATFRRKFPDLVVDRSSRDEQIRHAQ